MQIEEAKEYLKNYKYDNEVREAIDTVLNELEMAEKVIDKRNEEKLELAEMNFTKSKVIDEMAKELRYQLAQRGDLYCVNFCENEKKCNINNCIEGIKQYFYKKVRNNGIKRK